MSKQQELKDRIYAHNQELKELSFGCLLRGIGIIDHFCIGHDSAFVYTRPIDNARDIHKFNHGYLGKNKEILGHPIQLQHVLRAIDKHSEEAVGITIAGEFIKDHYCGMGESSETGIFYDMKKTFDQNITDNPELLDFLLEVIK